MAQETPRESPADIEYRASMLGQYERITGRDWYKIEELMKEGDLAATVIFVADHIIQAIESASDNLKNELGEKLENIWGQVADANVAAKKNSRGR